MSIVEANGVKLYYQETGSGEETLVFSHGLLWSHHMFRAQVEYFKSKYRIIAYDHRGQGQSEYRTPFDMDTLADDAAALIRTLCDGPVHFAGLSMGGFIGMRLGARCPELIKTLILLETSANAEPVDNHPKYKTLNALVRWLGVLPIVANQVMPIMFAQSWLANPANKEEADYWKSQLQKNGKGMTAAVQGVIDRKGVEDELSKISSPTLIIVGDEDVATKPEKAKFIQMRIKGSKLHMVAGAGHSSCIEKPSEVNRLLEDWLENRL
jgi:pimeloyl-ACP methyl ester carboxylesterase